MARYEKKVGTPEEAFKDQERVQERIRLGIDRAQLDSAMALERAVVQDTDAAKLVDTGLFKNSWKTLKLFGRGGGYEVANDAPYAGVIEQGARPFTPPLKPLVDWVERKAADLGVVRTKRYRGRASLTDAQRSACYRIAKAIQRKFAREGIRPRYLMRNRIPYAERMLRRAMEEYVDRAARG